MKKIFNIVLFVLLGLTPFLPSLGSIDKIASNYFFLGIFQLIISIYLIRTKQNKINLNLIDTFYLGFIFISFLSIFKSINKTEAIIEWIQYITLFISYFNLKILFSFTDKSQLILINILATILTVEVVVVIYEFISIYSFDVGIDRVKELQGLSPNLNIGAFSILIKIPVLIYLIYKYNNTILKLFFIAVLTSSIFCIQVISSRGAILGLFFSLFFVFFHVALNRTNKYKFAFLFLFSFVVSSIGQSILYKKNESLISTNRVVNLVDQSSKDRIEYYKASLDLFTENPLLGIGIGNWKISSLEKLKHNIRDYTVPYHTHNDYLQILSEIGIIGFFFFLMLSIFPIYLLIKKLHKSKYKIGLLSFILLSFLVYFLDSNLNFPRIRPYSQMNYIYLLAFVSSIDKYSLFKKKFNTNGISKIIFFILLPLTFAHSKFLHSYNQVYFLFADFNSNPNNLLIPIETVEKYQESFPNITNTTIPIKTAKANYYVQNNKYDKAIQLISESKSINPYLGFDDLLMSKIYYEKDLKDSAFFYSKIAYEKLPLNTSHILLYQTLLFEQNNFKELSDLFKKSKIIINEKLWKNHFYGLIKDPSKKTNGYTKQDSLDIKTAMKYFPNNNIFKSYDLIINGGEKINAAIGFDQLAKSFFENEDYLNAISSWEKASELIINEDSYLLNIAFAYAKIERYDKALENLKLIENRNIKSFDGQFEYLTAVSFIGLSKTYVGCNYLRKSKSLGYEAANSLLEKINCQTQ